MNRSPILGPGRFIDADLSAEVEKGFPSLWAWKEEDVSGSFYCRPNGESSLFPSEDDFN